MSISRRLFLRAGSLVVLTAAAESRIAKAVVGQSSRIPGQKTNAGNSLLRASASDPLAFFTMATFAAHVNSMFRLRWASSKSAIVTLVKVTDLSPTPSKIPSNRECFALLFRGSKQLTQQTYTLEHGALGTFTLLLVPRGKDSKGMYLEAIVNRLHG